MGRNEAKMSPGDFHWGWGGQVPWVPCCNRSSAPTITTGCVVATKTEPWDPSPFCTPEISQLCLADKWIEHRNIWRAPPIWKHWSQSSAKQHCTGTFAISRNAHFSLSPNLTILASCHNKAFKKKIYNIHCRSTQIMCTISLSHTHMQPHTL